MLNGFGFPALGILYILYIAFISYTSILVAAMTLELIPHPKETLFLERHSFQRYSIGWGMLLNRGCQARSSPDNW